MIALAKKKCATKWCRNRARAGRCYCHKCRTRAWRERHPQRKQYHILKWSAKLRKIPFLLTYEEFGLFCDLTGYLENVGNSGASWTVDRRDDTLGYFLDNLQILTNSQNVRKGNTFRANAKNRKFRAPGVNTQTSGKTQNG